MKQTTLETKKEFIDEFAALIKQMDLMLSKIDYFNQRLYGFEELMHELKHVSNRMESINSDFIQKFREELIID